MAELLKCAGLSLGDMGAGIIVAVDLNGVKSYRSPSDVMEVISNAIDIGIDLRTRTARKPILSFRWI